uniref:EF-hand domain-containing protein n=1 Tax=Acrobeloides nanus TaxID=290746 RepID=A0A914E011_9BILA
MVHHGHHTTTLSVRRFRKRFDNYDKYRHGHLTRYQARALFDEVAGHHGHHHAHIRDFNRAFHHRARQQDHEYITFKDALYMLKDLNIHEHKKHHKERASSTSSSSTSSSSSSSSILETALVQTLTQAAPADQVQAQAHPVKVKLSTTTRNTKRKNPDQVLVLAAPAHLLVKANRNIMTMESIMRNTESIIKKNLDQAQAAPALYQVPALAHRVKANLSTMASTTRNTRNTIRRQQVRRAQAAPPLNQAQEQVPALVHQVIANPSMDMASTTRNTRNIIRRQQVRRAHAAHQALAQVKLSQNMVRSMENTTRQNPALVPAALVHRVKVTMESTTRSMRNITRKIRALVLQAPAQAVLLKVRLSIMDIMIMESTMYTTRSTTRRRNIENTKNTMNIESTKNTTRRRNMAHTIRSKMRVLVVVCHKLNRVQIFRVRL